MFENPKEYLVVYMVGNSYEYHWCNTEEEMNEFIKGRKAYNQTVFTGLHIISTEILYGGKF